MKKKYYKVRVDKNEWWVSTPEDLKMNIVDWVSDYNKLTITTVFMSEEIFEKLPEYAG